MKKVKIKNGDEIEEVDLEDKDYALVRVIQELTKEIRRHG